MSEITEEELQEIVEVVWMTVLELPVGPGSEEELALTEYQMSVIEITGAWHGVVTVKASLAFLEHAASVMFSTAIDDVQPMDCVDTLAELTNMLGGTVKCLLPEICDLSLPTIVPDGQEDTTQHDWINITCEGLPLAVAVTQAAENSDIAA